MGTRSKHKPSGFTEEEEKLIDKLIEEDIGKRLTEIMHSPEFAEHFFKVQHKFNPFKERECKTIKNQ